MAKEDGLSIAGGAHCELAWGVAEGLHKHPAVARLPEMIGAAPLHVGDKLVVGDGQQGEEEEWGQHGCCAAPFKLSPLAAEHPHCPVHISEILKLVFHFTRFRCKVKTVWRRVHQSSSWSSENWHQTKNFEILNSRMWHHLVVNFGTDGSGSYTMMDWWMWTRRCLRKLLQMLQHSALQLDHIQWPGRNCCNALTEPLFIDRQDFGGVRRTLGP